VGVIYIYIHIYIVSIICVAIYYYARICVNYDIDVVTLDNRHCELVLVGFMWKYVVITICVIRVLHLHFICMGHMIVITYYVPCIFLVYS
jgi:hypothetical protein